MSSGRDLLKKSEFTPTVVVKFVLEKFYKQLFISSFQNLLRKLLDSSLSGVLLG